MVVLEDESVAATCVDAGSQTSQCSVCGERTVTPIAATGHTPGDHTPNNSEHSLDSDAGIFTVYTGCLKCNGMAEITVTAEVTEETFGGAETGDVRIRTYRCTCGHEDYMELAN